MAGLSFRLISEVGLETRSADSSSCSTFESTFKVGGTEAGHVQQSEGEDAALSLGLSSLRSETQNSCAPVGAPKLGHTFSAPPAAGSGLDTARVTSAVPSPRSTA